MTDGLGKNPWHFADLEQRSPTGSTPARFACRQKHRLLTAPRDRFRRLLTGTADALARLHRLISVDTATARRPNRLVTADWSAHRHLRERSFGGLGARFSRTFPDS